MTRVGPSPTLARLRPVTRPRRGRPASSEVAATWAILPASPLGLLGLVHVSICLTDQLVERPRALRVVQRDPDAQRQRKRAARHLVCPPQGVLDTRHEPVSVGGRDLCREDRELVAAESCDQVGRPKRPVSQQVGDLPKRPIPGLVAEAVVDLLEAVEVGEEEPEPVPRSDRRTQLLLGERREAAPVQQPREPVGERKRSDGLDHLVALGHVAQDDERAGITVPLVLDRVDPDVEPAGLRWQ